MRLLILLLIIALAGCQAAAIRAPAHSPTPQEKMPDEAAQSAYEMNARLGRGINLGNALEAPSEGSWGVTLQAEYFRLIKEQGFQSVRVPIRWSAHAAEETPYSIDEEFFQRVDWVVEQALANDLAVILNIHHYEEMIQNPQSHRARFLALWQQIASRYQDAPPTVLFELLNEPSGDAMPAGVWNEFAQAGLDAIRATNPGRFVVIGPVQWNSVDRLDALRLPEEDRRILVTFHYYQPFEFTHQGAEWNPGSDRWLGTTWEASDSQKSALRRDFEKARQWSEKNDRPILLGEFGAYSKADLPSRARWTEFVAREAEVRGFSWAYWEFCSGFGIYDAQKRVFFPALLEALIPPETK